LIPVFVSTQTERISVKLNILTVAFQISNSLRQWKLKYQ
jgi:hypothetical protein